MGSICYNSVIEHFVQDVGTHELYKVAMSKTTISAVMRRSPLSGTHRAPFRPQVTTVTSAVKSVSPNQVKKLKNVAFFFFFTILMVSRRSREQLISPTPAQLPLWSMVFVVNTQNWVRFWICFQIFAQELQWRISKTPFF